ncbi:MAG: 3-deoxy-D-manno-octulosonic acid transferase, partial [Planctomyces sp.]
MPGCVRRSSPDQGSRASGRFLLDTIGELRAAYALADLVVVGRSFGRLFGSDPIEPVALGKPTIIGPRFGDFALIVDALRADNAIRVVDAVDLAST